MFVEGTLLLEVDGQPPRTLKAGDAFFVEAGKVHDARTSAAVRRKVLRHLYRREGQAGRFRLPK